MAAHSSGGVYTHKVALCGKSDVGKTSIFTRLKSNDFFPDTSRINNENCLITVKDSEGNAVQIQLWDTLGMERYADLTRRHYMDSKVVLLVYSCDEMDSLEVLKHYYDTSTRHAPGAKMILVRNKIDLEFQSIDENEAIGKLCGGEGGHHWIFSCHIATSAKTGDGIDELRTELGNLLCNTEPAVMNHNAFGAFEVNRPSRTSNQTVKDKDRCCLIQ